MATFPPLSTTELLSALHDIGYERATLEDLNRPNASRIIPIYAWFLEQFLDLTLDDVRVCAELNLETLSEPDIFRESIHIGTLWRILNQIMLWACVEDFSPRDIRDPQPNRVRRILAGLVNFFLFAEDQKPHLETLEHQVDTLLRKEDDQERKLVELNDAIARKENEIESRKPEVASLESEIDQARRNLLELKSRTKVESEKNSSLKTEKDSLKDRAETMALQINQHDGQIVGLRSKIVQSPNRVKQNLSDMHSSLAAMKSDVVELEHKKLDHDARIAILRRYSSDLQAIIRTLDEWENEKVKAGEEHSRLRRAIDERDSRNNEIKELELRVQQLDRRIASALDQRDRLSKQADAKRDAIRQRMARLQETHDSLMAERAGIENDAAIRHRAIAQKEREIADVQKGLENELAKASASYQELRNEVVEFSRKLNKAIDALNLSDV